jgi:hypothetical protein
VKICKADEKKLENVNEKGRKVKEKWNTVWEAKG